MSPPGTARGTIVGNPDDSDTYTAAGAGTTFLLRAAGFVAVLAILVGVFTRGVAILAGAITALLPIVLIFGMYYLIFRLLLFGTSRRSHRNRGSGLLGSAARGTTSGVARMLAAPLRWSGTDEQVIPIVRFRIRSVTGETHDCELLGEPTSVLHRGDVVEVHGRRLRNGTLRASRVVVPVSGVVVRGRGRHGYYAARVANVIAAVVLVVAGTGLVYLLVVPAPL